MTECERLLMELEDKVAKWRSAREASQKPDASEREKSDFKIVEGEYLGLLERVRKCVLDEGRSKIGLGLPRWNIPAQSPAANRASRSATVYSTRLCNPWLRAAVSE
jgi:hypothetical protein